MVLPFLFFTGTLGWIWSWKGNFRLLVISEKEKKNMMFVWYHVIKKDGSPFKMENNGVEQQRNWTAKQTKKMTNFFRMENNGVWQPRNGNAKQANYPLRLKGLFSSSVKVVTVIFYFNWIKCVSFFFFHSCSKSIMKQWRPITTLQLIKRGLWPKEEVIVDTIFF